MLEWRKSAPFQRNYWKARCRANSTSSSKSSTIIMFDILQSRNEKFSNSSRIGKTRSALYFVCQSDHPTILQDLFDWLIHDQDSEKSKMYHNGFVCRRCPRANTTKSRGQSRSRGCRSPRRSGINRKYRRHVGSIQRTRRRAVADFEDHAA